MPSPTTIDLGTGDVRLAVVVTPPSSHVLVVTAPTLHALRVTLGGPVTVIGGGAAVALGPDPPVDPEDGDMWIPDGSTYVFFDGFWIEV